MRHFLLIVVLTVIFCLTGCKGQLPDVATAYADKYGKVQTSRFTACPTIQGVWHLSNLSGGSLKLGDDQPVQHFRWYIPYLFNLASSADSYIAVSPGQLATVLFLSPNIPGSTGNRNMLSFTERTEAEIPCVGHGWRRVAQRNFSTNDAAARVLNLVPEKSPKIVQTDYIARTADHELLLGTRIDYSGIDAKNEALKINDGYWHFVKMPRLHEDPKAQGFKQ
jgi:hypothetical protein